MSCCFYWWTTLLVPGSLLILGPCITCWSPLRDGLCMSHDTDLSHYWSYLVVCCWCCLVAKLCLTLMTLWTASYSVHGISQSRLLEWFAISFSRASSQPRDQTQVSHIAGRFFTNWAISQKPTKPPNNCKWPDWQSLAYNNFNGRNTNTFQGP